MFTAQCSAVRAAPSAEPEPELAREKCCVCDVIPSATDKLTRFANPSNTMFLLLCLLSSVTQDSCWIWESMDWSTWCKCKIECWIFYRKRQKPFYHPVGRSKMFNTGKFCLQNVEIVSKTHFISIIGVTIARLWYDGRGRPSGGRGWGADQGDENWN